MMQCDLLQCHRKCQSLPRKLSKLSTCPSCFMTLSNALFYQTNVISTLKLQKNIFASTPIQIYCSVIENAVEFNEHGNVSEHDNGINTETPSRNVGGHPYLSIPLDLFICASCCCDLDSCRYPTHIHYNPEH